MSFCFSLLPPPILFPFFLPLSACIPNNLKISAVDMVHSSEFKVKGWRRSADPLGYDKGGGGSHTGVGGGESGVGPMLQQILHRRRNIYQDSGLKNGAEGRWQEGSILFHSQTLRTLAKHHRTLSVSEIRLEPVDSTISQGPEARGLLCTTR